jgi:hypothetical protein
MLARLRTLYFSGVAWISHNSVPQIATNFPSAMTGEETSARNDGYDSSLRESFTSLTSVRYSRLWPTPW